MMRTVQLAIADTVYAAALRDTLSRSGPWHVDLVERPDPALFSVLVLDEAALRRLPLPLAHPERVVLITQNDPNHLKDAWEAGVNSVVSEQDPPTTVVLAILSACLRSGSANPRHAPGRSL